MITTRERFLARGGDAANLDAVNETPLRREVVVEVDTAKIKVGDGETPYNDLLYVGPQDTDDLPEGSENLYFPEAPINGQVYGRQDGGWVGIVAGTGSVTSVGLSAPTGLDVSGSPVTTSGTLALSWSSGYQGYTTTEATKLAGIAAGAQVNVATNLAQGTRTTTAVPVTSSTGTSATLDAATTSLAGVMSSADKSKLDGVAAGATVGAAWSTNLTGIPANITAWAGIAPASKWDTLNATAANLATSSPSVEADLNTPLGGPFKLIRASGATTNRPALVLGAGFYIPVDANSGAEFFFRAHPTISDVWTRPASAGAFGPWAKLFVDNQNLIPAADATYNIGSAAFRMLTVFAQTGTINTSDAREKYDVRALSENEIKAAVALSKEVKFYQWKDSVTKKGADKARWHSGMVVQRAIQVMQSFGLDPFRYAFICYDQWPEEPQVVGPGGEVMQPYRAPGDRYSFRLDQLNEFISAGLSQRVSQLETRFAKTLATTTTANGVSSATFTLPADNMALSVTPRTGDAVVSGITQTGRNVTVGFRRLRTSGISLLGLVNLNLFETSPGVVTFDVVATPQS